MSQRTDRVESLVHQIVARGLLEALGSEAARLTVTRVLATPDIRQVTVWVGIVGDELFTKELFAKVESERIGLQHLLASSLTTRSTPRLSFVLDLSGQYAAGIDDLLKAL